MAGLSGELRCEGFIESSAFEKSKEELKRSTGLTDRQIDDRLEGLVWALLRDPSAVSRRIGNLNLWVAVTTVGIPLLRVYIRPRAGTARECEWVSSGGRHLMCTCIVMTPKPCAQHGFRGNYQVLYQRLAVRNAQYSERNGIGGNHG
jgi:hypothetical protein